MIHRALPLYTELIEGVESASHAEYSSDAFQIPALPCPRVS